MPLSLVQPRVLLVPYRLDLIVKHRMFRHLMTGGDPEAEALYRWHIEQRTGGREPGSQKHTVDDYVAGAGALLTSMRANGFLEACPVRVGSNGRMTAGAHRTACAVALRLRVWRLDLAQPGRAADWGSDWFLSRGMAADKVAALETEREMLRA